jgi:hypothetical protein
LEKSTEKIKLKYALTTREGTAMESWEAIGLLTITDKQKLAFLR